MRGGCFRHRSACFFFGPPLSCRVFFFGGPLAVQGESADKKLAPRKVAPFLLKNAGLYGPKVTFYFLKMWKLAVRGPIRARTIESLHSATEISRIDSLRAGPLSVRKAAFDKGIFL